MKSKKSKLTLDKKGYFTIKPFFDKNQIGVRFHDYKGKVLKTIFGKDSKELYKRVIMEKLVTELNHAAYLGKELEKACIALKNKLEYVQDSELNIKKKAEGQNIKAKHSKKSSSKPKKL